MKTTEKISSSFQKNAAKISYDVVKIFHKTGKRITLHEGCKESEAQRIVKSFPDNENYIVCYCKTTKF